MQFPNELVVTTRSRDTGAALENIALVLTLFAAGKNNYSVGPLITNSKGEVEFTQDECRAAIRHAREMFVMDYADDLENCLPFIEVKVHSVEQIKTMLRQYNDSPVFWGRAFSNPGELFSKLPNVRNGDYEPSRLRATEEQLSVKPHMEILLDRAGASGEGGPQ